MKNLKFDSPDQLNESPDRLFYRTPCPDTTSSWRTYRYIFTLKQKEIILLLNNKLKYAKLEAKI